MWIVDRPKLTLLVLIVISCIALAGHNYQTLVSQGFLQQALNNDNSDEESGASSESASVPDVESVNLTDSDAILVCESSSFFTPVGASAMRDVVKQLENLNHVDSVLWLDRVPILNIFGLPEPLLPRSTSAQGLYDAAKSKALRHPLVKGQLLSSDGKTMLLMIRFDMLFIQQDSDCTTLIRETAEQAISEHAGFEAQFMVTGRVPSVLTALETHEANQLKYQLIGYGMIFIMSIILFRGLSAVLIVAAAPAMGVFWTLGIIEFFNFADSPFIDVILPVLISLVGLTDGVHLMVQIRRNRVSGLRQKEAARDGIKQVGLACGLTSLTTAIGFGSLSLAHHEMVREFGWTCVIGVVLTFVAVVTIIPFICSSRLGQRFHVGHEKSLVDRNLNKISHVIDFVLARTGRLTILGVLLTIGFIAVSLTLRPDEKRENALPTQSEAAIALRKIDAAMGGMESSSVDITWSPSVPSDSPEVLSVIRQVDDLLSVENLIGHPISIRNLLDALPGEGADADRMSMLELLPPPLKRAFYEPELRSATVSFRVQDLGIAKYGPVFERIESGLKQIQNAHAEFDLSMSGQAVWRWENLYQIVVDLAASLGTAAIIIFIVLSLVYRSLKIGLISIIPNLFPLALAGSYLAMTGQSLEIVSVCAFTVCLGIAVDDTIHFLTRYLEEKKKHSDERTAIRNAFTGVGTALIMTTVILVAGFMTVMFSDSRDHRIFASMGAITVAAALFGDMIFLPAILAFFGDKESSQANPTKKG